MFALERVRAKHFTKAWGKLNCSNIYYHEKRSRPTPLPSFAPVSRGYIVRCPDL